MRLMAASLIALFTSTLGASCSDQTMSYLQTGAANQEVIQPKAGCDHPSVKTITIPKNHHQSGATFDYRFQHVVIRNDAVTVVVLPGGPGGNDIGSQDRDDIFPAHYNRVFIDPRGVGCNYYPATELADELLSTEQHALDVIEVIKALNLQDYTLFGVSYGTVVGTVLAHKIQQMDMPKPKSLNLMGTLGRSFVDAPEADAEYQRQWNALMNKVPAARELFHNRHNLPLGIDSLKWAQAVSYFLMFEIETLENILQFLTSERSPSPDQEGGDFDDTATQIRDYIEDINEAMSAQVPGEDRFYRNVACREIVLLDDYTLTFDRGGLVRQPINEVRDIHPDAKPVCQGLQLDRRFDSRNYQISVPIYYIQGSRDAATSLQQAMYHFEGQARKNENYFINVMDAGHSPLSHELAGCRNEFWNTILELRDPSWLLHTITNRCVNRETEWPLPGEHAY